MPPPAVLRHRLRQLLPALPAVLAALLAASCSAPLPYRPLDPGLTEARAGFAARRLEGPALAGFLAQSGERLPAPGEAWSFEALALAAGWYSADVAAAQARWQAAVERRSDGRLPAGWAVDGLVDHHSLTDSSRPQPWTLGLGFEFTLPSAQRQTARDAQLDAAVELARIDLAQAFWEARRRVREPWLEVIRLSGLVPLLERERALREDAAAGLETRVRLGESAPAQRWQSRLAVEQAQSALAAAQRQQRAAQAALAVALGLPDGAPPLALALPAEPAGVALAATAASTQAALDNRLDLRAAEARFQAADADLRWEVAQQYPQYSFRPGYEWDQGDHRLRIGLALPLALPSAHRAQVVQAEAEREARARELRGRQDQVMQEAGQAVRALVDGVAERDAQRTRQALARQATAAALASQEHGEVDALQVIDARLAELVSEQQLLAAGHELAVRQARLEDVAQRPLAGLFSAATQAAGTRAAQAGSGAER